MDVPNKPLIVVQLTIRRSALEPLYDELARLPKRARAGFVRYVLSLVNEGRCVARVQPASNPPNENPITVKVQFKANDPDYNALEALGPSLRAGPLRAKLLLYCQGAVLVDTTRPQPDRPLVSDAAHNADEDIAQAFGLSIEPHHSENNG